MKCMEDDLSTICHINIDGLKKDKANDEICGSFLFLLNTLNNWINEN